MFIVFYRKLYFISVLKFIGVKFFIISSPNILLSLSVVSDVPSLFDMWLFVSFLFY